MNSRLAKRIGKGIRRGLVSSVFNGLNRNTEKIRSMMIAKTPDRLDRKDGISLMIVCRNEPWLDLSIMSVKDIVDEIIIVDASDKDWSPIVDKVARKHKARLFRVGTNYKEQTKTAVEKSRHKWLLRWDADFVAFPNIHGIPKFIENLDDTHHAITMTVQNLDLDPFRYNVEHPRHNEKYLFTYSPRLIRPTTPLALWFQHALSFRGKGYVRGLPRRIGYMPAPVWFKRHRVQAPIALHLRTLKPWQRIVEKKFQPHWTLMKPEKKAKYDNDMWKLVEACCDPLKLCHRMLDELEPKLKRYTGPYPSIMVGYMEHVLGVEFGNTVEFKEAMFKHLNRFWRTY